MSYSSVYTWFRRDEPLDQRPDRDLPDVLQHLDHHRPARWIIPKIGGFSLSRAPRPRALQPAPPTPAAFFHRVRMPFVTGHDVDFVALHFPDQDRFGLAGDDPVPTARSCAERHPGSTPTLGNLGIREVQAHEIQTQDPYP